MVVEVTEQHDRNSDTILSTRAQGLLLKAAYSSGSLGAACACVSLLAKMMTMMMKLDDDGDVEDMYPPTHP